MMRSTNRIAVTLLSVLALSQSACNILLDSMLTEGARENRLNDELEKIQKTCSEGHQAGLAYLALKPEDRKIGDIVTGASQPQSLIPLSRKLSICREQIEDALQVTVNSELGEKIQVVKDPKSEGFELGGKKVSLADAYRDTFALEKKVLAEKIDFCSTRRGVISSRGDGVNDWTPLQITLQDWKAEDCATRSGPWKFDPSTPSDIQTQVKSLCPKSEIGSSDFMSEKLEPRLYRKWANVTCERAKERKPGSAAVGTPKVPATNTCELCKTWVK